MCGRFTLRTPARDLVDVFQLLRTPELVPRYNIAPTQPAAVVRRVERHRELSMMRWGLVPSWSKDPKAGPPLINARADTVATKPSFRSAFKARRCLVPADGFYEWQKTGEKTLTADETTDLVQDPGVIRNGESVTVGNLAGKRRSESLRS